MNPIASSLLERFDRGLLTRRDLVQGLAIIASLGSASAQEKPPSENPALKAAKIDHVSIQVSDLPRAVAFYESTFGLAVVGEDKPNEIVRLGVGRALVSLHHKSPTGLVDHFAIGIEKFNRESVTQTLKARGIDTSENLDAGFHIKDPEGMSVQIVGA
jgi:catechol 2,3-dioxygenase-like lactoylglutathione lyase family enzyme